MSDATAIGDGQGVSFLVHKEGDHVGVAVEDVAVGKTRAAFMDSGREIDVTVQVPIPLGHKVALDDLAAGADVLEYGERIGRTRSAISRGELVHVHNLRSARWEASQ